MAHFFINTVFISTTNQFIPLLDSIQTLVFIILREEHKHVYLLHNLSLRLHPFSICVMPFSSPIATAVHSYAWSTEHGWE